MNYTQVAKKYIQNGFNVLPLQQDGSKKPIGKWRHLQDRYASEHECQEWFGSGKCGIGVVAGSISGNLHLLDFDIEAKKYFDHFWTDAQQQLPGIVAKLAVVATPRPGYQVWFRQQSTPPKSQQLALGEPRPTGDVDADGNPVMVPEVLIETRGTGGYACAVGTAPQTHPTGRPYQLIHGSFELLPALTDAEVETLLNICRGYSRWQPEHVQRQSGEKYQGEPRPGDVFNQHADMRKLLLDAGWKVHHSEDDAEYLTRPGKNVADGYSATLGYVRTEDDKPLLMVFTSAIAPFKSCGCYDAFACYALLHHGGDFGQAAAAARIQYAEQVTEAQQAFHAQIAEKLPEAETYQPFPVRLLPDVVQAYVVEHAAAIGIDSAYVAVPMLSVLAGLIGQSRGLYLKRNWQLPSIIWGVTIGDVSSGKTPGWEAATAPAEQIEASLHRAMRQRDEDYKQQLEAYEKAKAQGNKSATKPTKEKHTEQLTINDATMEVLIDIHSDNNKLILACDELAAWLRGMDQYRAGKGRDVENWLSIYNGGSMQVNRKTDNYRIYLPRTSISVCGTIQPGVAAETLFTDRFIENGFAARILSVKPPSSIVRWSEREVPASIDNAMHSLAKKLYLLPGEPHGAGHRTLMLPCSDDAKQTFIQFTNDTADHAETMETVLRSSWLKLRPVAGRFALVFSVIKQLLHCPEGQAMQPVDAESMQAGIDLAWWFGHELERNYALNEQIAIRKHLDWILSNHPAGIDARTLVAGRRGIKTAGDARIVMQNLIELGCGRLEGTRFIPNAEKY